MKNSELVFSEDSSGTLYLITEHGEEPQTVEVSHDRALGMVGDSETTGVTWLSRFVEIPEGSREFIAACDSLRLLDKFSFGQWIPVIAAL